MKEILLSVKPKCCELISKREKTVVVRKTKPKLDTPFKVYIYCTNDSEGDLFMRTGNKFLGYHCESLQGKVIGEFVCDSIERVNDYIPNELYEYGINKTLYAWHISALLIYSRPKELKEFKNNRSCYYDHLGLATPKCKDCKGYQVVEPPKNWCYVESEVQEDEI